MPDTTYMATTKDNMVEEVLTITKLEVSVNKLIGFIKKQEAFRERKHLHVHDFKG